MRTGSRKDKHGEGGLAVVSASPHIWIVSEFYYPELTSTGHFLTGIAEGLASAYKVGVLCGQPSYWARGERAPSHEDLSGVEVHRYWATKFDKNKLHLRVLNMITISVTILWAALHLIRRGDIVIAVTNPPLLPYLMALVCRLRGARFVLLVHDVYPEILGRVGILSRRSKIFYLLNRVSCWLYENADRVIVLGRDMRDLVVQKVNCSSRRIVIATNWGDTETICPQPLSANRLLNMLNLKERFVSQYCGNIGRLHGIRDIVEVAEMFASDPEFQFLLIGWGAKKRWAIQQIKARKLENLIVLDPLPREELCDGLNACNVALVSFSIGMTGICVPSRMYNIMAAGKPMLAVCDDDSELATVVREEGIGWVVPPGQPELIALTLRGAKANLSHLQAMGERARKVAEAKYTRSRVVQVYRELIEDLRSA